MHTSVVTPLYYNEQSFITLNKLITMNLLSMISTMALVLGGVVGLEWLLGAGVTVNMVHHIINHNNHLVV